MMLDICGNTSDGAVEVTKELVFESVVELSPVSEERTLKLKLSLGVCFGP